MAVIEGIILNNIIGIFGGSPLLAGLFFIGLFALFLMMLKVPFIVITPVLFGFMILVAGLMGDSIGTGGGTFKLILGLIGGFAVGYFIYSLWMGR